MASLLSFLAASLIAATHLLTGRPGFHLRQGSAWLSAAGGASVAYVFIYLLPKLAKKQALVDANIGAGLLGHWQNHVYLVAMLGLILFHGTTSVRNPASPQRRTLADKLHIASFVLYALIVGHLLANFDPDNPLGLALAAVTLALHFIGTDLERRHRYASYYASRVRWFLAIGVYAGWLIGEAFAVPKPVQTLLFAFLAGAIIINVMREEIPDESQVQGLAFLGGAIAYTALIVLILESDRLT